MNLNICILFCFFEFPNVFGIDRVLFLDDYLKKLKSPSILIAHLCWGQDQYTKLQQVLNKSSMRYILRPSNYVSGEHGIYRRIFLADMDCPFFDSVIKHAFNTELLKYPNKWIIFGNLTNLKRRNHYFPINSYAVVVEETKINHTLKIQALYKIKDNTKYLENAIGMWSLEKGFLFYKELSISRNRTDFFKMPLRVSYVFLDNSSLNHITDNRYNHIDKLTKINYLMFEHFVDIWNMTHTKIFTDDWGLEFHPTKHYYRGMLGDLNYGRADVSGTVAFTPVERQKYFKYLLSTVKGTDVNFVFRAPPLAYSANLFALPFHRNVWICCAITLVSCCLVIWIIMRWEESEESFAKQDELYEENPPCFLDIVMMQIAVVCQMEYFHEPKSTSGKIATFTLLLGFSYIYTAFCARIVILLQSTANNLNDLRALYDAKFEMGVEDNPYNRFYFSRPQKRTNEEMRKLIYDTRIAPKGQKPKFYANSEGIELVRTSYFAFHIEITTATNIIQESFTNEEKCSIRKVESVYKIDIPHLSCPRNSTFVEYFLIGFHRMFETGIHSRERVKIFSILPKCTGRSNIFVSVGLIECYFALEIFIIGVALSIFIFVLEIIVDKYQTQKEE